MAITSLVLAFFVPLLAIIFGIIGLIQISNSQGRLRGSGLAIAGLAVSCFWSFLVMPAILFPVFAQAREKARTVSCESNQRQLALAIIMYSQDNNEQLPPSMSATTLATPGTLSARLYTCPSATTHAAAGDYGYNTHLAKRALGDIADPATTILTADSDRPDASLATTDDIAWTRHHTGCVISFVDGHVAIKTKDDSGSITLGPATRKAN
jgi:prepilin-type processing-associated H-X9-DG protein